MEASSDQHQINRGASGKTGGNKGMRKSEVEMRARAEQGRASSSNIIIR